MNKFEWHTSRGEALYYDDDTKQIVGRLSWTDDTRRNIRAEYLGPKIARVKERKDEVIAAASEVWLGNFFDEKAAKDAVVEYVERTFPSAKEVAA